MFELLRKIFRSLFGGSAGQPSPQPEAARPTKPQSSNEGEPEPEAAIHSEEGTSDLLLRRYSQGRHDTLGKLYVSGELMAYTMEGPQDDPDLLPEGTYTIFLQQKGGKHATYHYRFGEYHQGLLGIQLSGSESSPTLSMGSRADHLYGSVVLGQEVEGEADAEKPREVLQSEAAYRKVYDLLLPKVNEDQPLLLTIEATK